MTITYFVYYVSNLYFNPSDTEGRAIGEAAVHDKMMT